MGAISGYPTATSVASTDLLIGDVSGVTKAIPVSLLGGVGQYTSTIPTSDTATGVAGQYTADAQWFYICTATNTWRKTLLRAVVPTFTYVADGDSNGLFYYLGENYGVGGWINPADIGTLVITASTTTLGATSQLTDRTTQDWYVNPASGSWVKFALQSGVTFLLQGINFRQRTNAKYDSAADFLIEGSNDDSTWTSLFTRTAAQVPSGSNAWAYWAVSGIVTKYRYFRIKQPASTSYFCICELELYGTF